MQVRVSIVLLFAVIGLCVPGHVFAQGSIRNSAAVIPVATAKVRTAPGKGAESAGPRGAGAVLRR